MRNVFNLFLEGHGYLESVEQKDGETFVRIRVEQMPPSESETSPDEIALYCRVERASLLSILPRLESRRLAGHKVLFSFRATYSHLSDCFHGKTPEDPKNMLIVHGQLQLISGWFQDCRWIFPESLTWETVQPISGAA